MSRFGATEVMGHGHAGSLAQLIADNNRPTEYISHEQRVAEWWLERAQEGDAIRAGRCSLCGERLHRLDTEYLRCEACGHLARDAPPKKSRKTYSRDRRGFGPRLYCSGCGKRRMRRMCVNGIYRECRGGAT